MSAYGLTLDEALDGFTLPQTQMMMNQMSKYPPIVLTAAVLMKGLMKKDESTHVALPVSSEGSVVTAQSKGADFWRSIGLDPKEING